MAKEVNAQQLNNKCAQVDAHSFHGWLNTQVLPNYTLRQALVDFYNGLHTNERRGLKNEINLTKQEIINLVVEFYNKFSPELGKKIDDILTGKDDRYKVSISKVSKKSKKSSSVGHEQRNNYLNMNVYFRGEMEDLVVLAHECAHAISSHHTKRVDIIRNKNANKQELNNLPTQKDFDRDCVGEIESHIMEKLFVQFLLIKGVISEQDLQEYKMSAQNSLFNDISTILQENDIINQLPCPITQESLTALVKTLQAENNKTLLTRLAEMCKDVKAQYRFRYVVAQIVSQVWLEKYLPASKQQKEEMRKQFSGFLTKTHQINVQQAVEFLLNMNIVDCAKEYISLVNSDCDSV